MSFPDNSPAWLSACWLSTLLPDKRNVQAALSARLRQTCGGTRLADYEVDFITYFTKLTGTKMGARFDDNAYLQSMQLDSVRL